jgi:hypothetical protein
MSQSLRQESFFGDLVDQALQHLTLTSERASVIMTDSSQGRKHGRSIKHGPTIESRMNGKVLKEGNLC